MTDLHPEELAELILLPFEVLAPEDLPAFSGGLRQAALADPVAYMAEVLLPLLELLPEAAREHALARFGHGAG